MNKKILSLLLVMVLLFGNMLSVSAAEKKMYYISAYTSLNDSYIRLPILESDNEAYIGMAEVSLLTGMNHEKSGKKEFFRKNKHSIEYTGKTLLYNGNKYYHLKNVMDELSTVYKYSEKAETLCFFPCKSFITNLWNDCMNIYMGKDFNYSMQYLANTWGVELAVLADILRKGAVDAVWGGYQRGQYEKALSGILLPNELQSELLEQAKDGHDIADALLKSYKSFGKIWGDADFKEMLGANATGFMEIYKKLSLDGKELELGDILDLTETFYTARNASETYVNAVKYGLYNNKNIHDINLKNATKTVYMHYDNNQPEFMDMLNEVGITVVENITTEAIKNSFELKNPYLTLMNVAMDEFLELDKPIDATIQGLMCNEIQKEAIKQNSKCLDGKTLAFNNPLQIKYSAILYLRAAQYAMEQFAFDDIGKWANSTWSEKTQDSINKLVAYSDEELTRTVKNDKINFQWKGFRTNASENVIEDDVVTEDKNESEIPESIVPPNTPTNETPSNSEENESSGTGGTITTGTFGMVDVIGKSYEEARKVLEENGFQFYGDKGSDGEYHLPDEIQIYQNEKWIAWGLNEMIPGVVANIQNINSNAFPITKELNSRITVEQAYATLEKTTYNIDSHEGTEKVRVKEDDNVVWKEVPVCRITVSNETWAFEIYWGGHNLTDKDSIIINNYNMYKDDEPKVSIWMK